MSTLPIFWSEVTCPCCGAKTAWLGDQGASIELFGRCLTCLLLRDHPEPWSPELEAELDAKVAQVQAVRESRERMTGRRVFPCVQHNDFACAYCGGRGWLVGYPPGDFPAS